MSAVAIVEYDGPYGRHSRVFADHAKTKRFYVRTHLLGRNPIFFTGPSVCTCGTGTYCRVHRRYGLPDPPRDKDAPPRSRSGLYKRSRRDEESGDEWKRTYRHPRKGGQEL